MGRLKTDTWERMLEQMEQEGVGFYLNGKKLRRGKLSEPAACGKSCIHAGFVMDEEGKLCEVRYDEVTNGKQIGMS